jgi:anti-sigma B factor antagonist
MDLGFREQLVMGAPVLALLGEADLATLPRLVERVQRFASEHAGEHGVVDLDGLSHLEPVALGVLIGARLQLRASGGELDVVCTEPALTALFVRSGLDGTFTLHATAAAALAR